MQFHILLSTQGIANFRESQKKKSFKRWRLFSQRPCKYIALSTPLMCKPPLHPLPSIAPDIWYNEKQKKTREPPLCILRVNNNDCNKKVVEEIFISYQKG